MPSKVPARICRRCGKAINCADGEPSRLRSLAVYCPRCAEIVAERREVRERRAPAVRVVRVRSGRNGWIEYRGTWPQFIFQGREIIASNH